MTGKQLRHIRTEMGLSQAGMAARLKMAPNSVARMERGEMIVTPPMELLIDFIARETRDKRDRERPAHTPGHEGKGLGNSSDVRVRRGKQQDPKKSSQR